MLRIPTIRRRTLIAQVLLGLAWPSGPTLAAETLRGAGVEVVAEASEGVLVLRHAAGTLRLRLARGGGEGSVHDHEDPTLGTGRQLRLRHEGGDETHVTQYRDLPFTLVRTLLRNPGAEDRLIVRDRLADGNLQLTDPGGAVRALGTAGLTEPDGHPGSYVFLALADPASRRGLAAGWLTFEKGDGILFSGKDEGRTTFGAQNDYGRLILRPGEQAMGETLALGLFDDARIGLERYADLVARVQDIRLPPQLDGYCTWYSRPHGGASDSEHIAELAAFAADELQPFGFDFVQIDDYWQDGARREGPAKVFVRHNPDGPYPDGMAPTAARIRALGLRPGLWYMPFAADREDPFFADKNHWFAKREDGSPYWARWGGTSLDLTHPEAQAYVAETARRITRDWGYQYLKLDGLWTGIAAQLLYVHNPYKPDDLGQALVHDPYQTPIQAYRHGLGILREAAGPDVFILGCNVSQNMHSFGASMGRVDAMRIGPDNGSAFESLRRGPWHGSNRYFLHGRVWYNDPDPIYVREQMPIEHAQLIASWIAISGQLHVSSDWLPGLPPERLDLLRRTLPSHGRIARPVDLFEQDLPRIWHLPAPDVGTGLHVVGLFNWDDAEAVDIVAAVSHIGLPEGEAWVAYEFWTHQRIAPFRDELRVSLPPGSCRVLALRPVRPHPQVLSTSRHVTQGIVDLESEQWDPDTHTLSGLSHVVQDDPYELRLDVPHGFKADSIQVSAGVASLHAHNGSTLARIQQTPTGPVQWSIRFTP